MTMDHRELAYGKIPDAITRRELKPGERVMEKRLSGIISKIGQTPYPLEDTFFFMKRF